MQANMTQDDIGDGKGKDSCIAITALQRIVDGIYYQRLGYSFPARHEELLEFKKLWHNA